MYGMLKMHSKFSVIVMSLMNCFKHDPYREYTTEQRRLTAYLSQATDRYHLEQLERAYMRDHKNARR
jgi:hypothetical protein